MKNYVQVVKLRSKAAEWRVMEPSLLCSMGATWRLCYAATLYPAANISLELDDPGLRVR